MVSITPARRPAASVGDPGVDGEADLRPLALREADALGVEPGRELVR